MSVAINGGQLPYYDYTIIMAKEAIHATISQDNRHLITLRILDILIMFWSRFNAQNKVAPTLF